MGNFCRAVSAAGKEGGMSLGDDGGRVSQVKREDPTACPARYPPVFGRKRITRSNTSSLGAGPIAVAASR